MAGKEYKYLVVGVLLILARYQQNMLSSLCSLLLLASSGLASPTSPTPCTSSTGTIATPVVTVKNGSFSGVYNPTYNQDFFLGIPYAQVGSPPPARDYLNVPSPQSTTSDSVSLNL